MNTNDKTTSPDHCLPKLVKIRQNLPVMEIDDPFSETAKELDRIGFSQMDLTGKRIGITAGSRGIHSIHNILKAIVEKVKSAGGIPMIIPAMGSHGGGTVQGQLDVLDGLGITEASVGAPIEPCPESIQVGETPEGIPAYCNRLATEMDGLIVANRIKKHTDFTGTIESGLHKMMTIGLGGPQGASMAHTHAMVLGYETAMTSIGTLLFEKLPMVCGVGIVENWKGGIAIIEAIAPEDFYEREAALLERDKEMGIKLPFDQANVLVVGELGKNISGAGMDGNIVGRTRLIRQADPKTPDIDRIVVLSLTPETHGNALGIGLADLTTKRVFDAVEVEKTALNCVTSMAPEHAAIPCTMANDREAILAAVRTAGLADEKAVRLAYIQNSKKIEYLAVSDTMLEEIKAEPRLEILGEPEEIQFDEEGNFLNFNYRVTP